MPSLESTAVAAWARERDVTIAGPPGDVHLDPAGDRAAWQEAVIRLGTLLDEARATNPAWLVLALGSEPVRTDLRAVLVQLHPDQVLRLLSWLTDPAVPGGGELLAALLSPNPSGLGQVAGAMLRSLHQRALLASIFHQDRVQALRRACRTIAKEAA